LLFFFVFSIRFYFSPLCHCSSPLFFLLSSSIFFSFVSLYNLTLSFVSFSFFLLVSVSLFSILSPVFFLSPPALSFALFLPLSPQNPPPCSVFPLPFLSFSIFCFYLCLSPPPKKNPPSLFISLPLFIRRKRERPLCPILSGCRARCRGVAYTQHPSHYRVWHPFSF
jgi:hypothetical protein